MNKAFCFLVLTTALLLLTSCNPENSSQSTDGISDVVADTENISETDSTTDITTDAENTDDVTIEWVTLSPEELDEKKALLNELTGGKGSNAFIGYPYLEKLVAGEIQPYSKRLTLEQVKEIIKNNPDSFDAIMQEIENAHPYADRVGGSGVTTVSIWFDDYGNEGLSIMLEWKGINYFKEGEIIHLFPIENTSSE